MPDDLKDGGFDPGRTLTYASLMFVGTLILFVCGIIAAQIVKIGEANTESWAALTGALGWAMGVASGLYNNRFGSTAQSAAKDLTIAAQAQTAATIAQAVPAAPLVPAGPIKTENVDIEAQNATVTTPPANEEK